MNEGAVPCLLCPNRDRLESKGVLSTLGLEQQTRGRLGRPEEPLGSTLFCAVSVQASSVMPATTH